MKLVILESPYAAPTAAGVAKNIDYARAAMSDCLNRGEAPYASHLLYTQDAVLDDKDPAQRKLGIDAGFEWATRCAANVSKVVVYTDRGITKGMQQGIVNANRNRIDIEFRSLGGEWAK